MNNAGGPATERFRFGALIETAILAGLVFGAGYLLRPDNPFQSGLMPHPLWIVVLAVALLHGFVESVAAAALCAVLFLVFVARPENGVYHISTFQLFQDYREPILFMIVGAVVGEATQVRRRRLLNAEAEKQKIDEERIRTDEQMTAAFEALRQLETRNVTQLTSIQALHRDLSRTADMSPEQIQEDMLAKLEQFIRAGACRYYEFERGALVCRAHRGGEPGPPAQDDMLLNQAMRDKSLATLGPEAAGAGMKTLPEHSLMAAPVCDAQGQVTGMVSINSIPFVDYTPHSIALFTTIVDWWGRALEEKRRWIQVRGKMVIDEETGLYNYSYFLRRVAQEFSRAHDFSIPMCLSLIRIQNYGGLSAEARAGLWLVVPRTVLNHVMEMHMASHYRTEDTVAITFPVMMADEADGIVSGIVREIQGYGLQPYAGSGAELELTWHSADYRIGMESFKELLQAAELGLDQGGAS